MDDEKILDLVKEQLLNVYKLGDLKDDTGHMDFGVLYERLCSGCPPKSITLDLPDNIGFDFFPDQATRDFMDEFGAGPSGTR